MLLAVAGGFGPLVNFLGSPMIRCYNRISIFIGFFAFCSLAIAADRIRSRLVAKPASWPITSPSAVVLILGLLDQVGPAFVPPYGQLKQVFQNEAEFVHQVESALPRRAMVFQLPSVLFLEAPPVGTMGSYDPFRAYLHSRHLRGVTGPCRAARRTAGEPGSLICLRRSKHDASLLRLPRNLDRPGCLSGPRSRPGGSIDPDRGLRSDGQRRWPLLPVPIDQLCEGAGLPVHGGGVACSAG